MCDCLGLFVIVILYIFALRMNLPTIIVLAALLVMVVLAIVSIRKHKVSDCNGCPLTRVCGKNKR